MHMPLVLTNRRRRGGSASAPAFSPSTLYSSGSQGVWYDPSDLSTMFVDRAGTIPITTPGTVVGKRLDKSGRGNHATAPTDAARPIYGVEPKGGRRNLLTWTEDLTNAIWVTSGLTTTSDGFTTTTTSNPQITQVATVTSGSVHTHSLQVKYVDAQWFRVFHTGAVSASVWIDILNGVVGTSTFTSATISAADVDGWRTVTIVTPATSTTSLTLYYTLSAGNSSTAEVIGAVGVKANQLELGSTASPYQRVTTAYNVTESGVATCHYVQYDGSDDSLSTSAIDFTATDKMSVFAGVTKLTDGSDRVLVELSSTVNTSNGSFGLFAPSAISGGVSGKYVGSLRGTAQSVTEMTGYAAPNSSVLTAKYDISGATVAAESVYRINGATPTQTNNGVAAGTGNFGNYPLFIGRRNNASLPFNGRDYGLIVVGKAASAGEITDTETWLAARTAQVTL